MSKIIRLYGDPHAQAQRLLPWYVNQTLDADEAATVDAHLAECAECRADLETERALALQVARLPADAGAGWDMLREQIEGRGPDAARPLSFVPRSFLRRPVPVGWALAAQAAAVLLVVGVTWRGAEQPADPAYHTLGAASAVATGNVIAIFRPDISEADMRGALIGSGARLVDGPTASNAYILRVDPARRAAAIAQLRASKQVVLAEPIDAGAPQ
jgi:hypothetical protein